VEIEEQAVVRKGGGVYATLPLWMTRFILEIWYATLYYYILYVIQGFSGFILALPSAKDKSPPPLG
jgi:hypothetical protein